MGEGLGTARIIIMKTANRARLMLSPIVIRLFMFFSVSAKKRVYYLCPFAGKNVHDEEIRNRRGLIQRVSKEDLQQQ